LSKFSMMWPALRIDAVGEAGDTRFQEPLSQGLFGILASDNDKI
jgi:hypothetical protein